MLRRGLVAAGAPRLDMNRYGLDPALLWRRGTYVLLMFSPAGELLANARYAYCSTLETGTN
eukprot:scaffold7452_cov95-Isochrysis_galbana.AAC.3